MGLSFLQQLLTVACLAFASGLLLGVAVLRGEVGDLREGGQAPAASSESRRRKRPRITWRQATKALASGVSDLDPALKWVLVSLVLMLSASAIITRLVE